MTTEIRPYRDRDRAAVYAICVDTAAAGAGVRGRYRTDDLVPDTAAGPYLFLEPEHAYVLDDGGRVAGYVIGTADTAKLVAAYQEQWLPKLRERYQPPPGPPRTEEERRLDTMFHPERQLRPELAAHPAHLHVNLLAGQRGAGHGRALIDTFLASVAAAGAKSCHLAVNPENAGALRFYEKLGWEPVETAAADRVYLTHPTG